MRFLINTPRAKRQRRYRLNCKLKGKCTRCPNKAERGKTICAKCIEYNRHNIRTWRTK